MKYKLLSFICFKCGCEITKNNFHSSRQCKECYKFDHRLSLCRSAKKWRDNNKLANREAQYDNKNARPFRDAERFIKAYRDYNPMKILNGR